jgi:pimeloyl-ACP methyl ester carboxylesterase
VRHTVVDAHRLACGEIRVKRYGGAAHGPPIRADEIVVNWRSRLIPGGWAEQSYHNLIYWNEVGHFAPWEQPEIFAAEIQAAFGSLR